MIKRYTGTGFNSVGGWEREGIEESSKGKWCMMKSFSWLEGGWGSGREYSGPRESKEGCGCAIEVQVRGDLESLNQVPVRGWQGVRLRYFGGETEHLSRLFYLISSQNATKGETFWWLIRAILLVLSFQQITRLKFWQTLYGQNLFSFEYYMYVNARGIFSRHLFLVHSNGLRAK